MAYDDVKNKPQGSIKASELFSDKDLDIIKTGVGESGIKILEQLVRISGDALRRLNYILFSTGQINWNGSSINFHANSRNNDVYFRLLQTEHSAPRTIDLKMVASTTNSANTFNSLDLPNNGDLIYLQLDRSTILSGSSTVNLENGVGTSGGSNPNYIVKRTNIFSAGMPELSTEEGGPTQTFYIPLAMRVDWSDGSTNYNDIWWIPHGIRWPAGTTSTLGSVIVKGLETLPTIFVSNQDDLQNALDYFVLNGGYILAVDSFTIDTSITLKPGVTFASRSRKDGNPATITMAPGGYLELNNYSTVERVYFTTTVSFGSTNTHDDKILYMSSTRGVVRDCSFNLSSAANNSPKYAIAIQIDGNENRINNCRFTGCASETWRIGIDYAGGNNNVDLDSIFD